MPSRRRSQKPLNASGTVGHGRCAAIDDARALLSTDVATISPSGLRRARALCFAGLLGLLGLLSMACGTEDRTLDAPDERCSPGDPTCARSIVLELCDEYPTPAPLLLDDARIEGDRLTLDYTRQGACPAPVFRACWNGALYDTIPGTVDIMVAVEGTEACEAEVAELLDVDLSIIRESLPDEGPLRVKLLGLDTSVTYAY